VGTRELPLVKVIAGLYRAGVGLDWIRKGNALQLPLPGTRVGEKTPAGQCSMNCQRKVSHELRLKDIAIAAGFHCRFHDSRIFKASQKYDFRRCADFFQAAGSLKAVHHGHHYVEDKYVWPEAQRSFNGLLPVQHGADHLKLDIQEPGDGPEDWLTVIG
jgi:hypothetical protein